MHCSQLFVEDQTFGVLIRFLTECTFLHFQKGEIISFTVSLGDGRRERGGDMVLYSRGRQVDEKR